MSLYAPREIQRVGRIVRLDSVPANQRAEMAFEAAYAALPPEEQAIIDEQMNRLLKVKNAGRKSVREALISLAIFIHHNMREKT